MGCCQTHLRSGQQNCLCISRYGVAPLLLGFRHVVQIIRPRLMAVNSTLANSPEQSSTGQLVIPSQYSASVDHQIASVEAILYCVTGLKLADERLSEIFVQFEKCYLLVLLIICKKVIISIALCCACLLNSQLGGITRERRIKTLLQWC